MNHLLRYQTKLMKRLSINNTNLIKTIRYVLMRNGIIAILFFTTFQVNGQILTVDRKEGSADPQQPFHAAVDLILDYDQLEGKVFEVASSADLYYYFDKSIITSISQFDMTVTDGESAIDAGYTHLRYIHNYQQRLAPEFFLQYQWDGVRGMKYRFLQGGNLRFSILADSTMAVVLGAGAFLEQEGWDNRAVKGIDYDPTTVIHNNMIKFNTYLKLNKKFSEVLETVFITYFQFPLNTNFKYPRIAPSVQLNVSILEHLSYKVTFSNFYDFKPVVPIDKYTFGIYNALVVEF